MPDLPQRFQVNINEVAAKVIDSEAIIINLTTGVYYSMDGLGAKVWSLLEAHHDMDAIVTALASEYEVTAAQCREDVAELTSQLFDENLLLATEEPPAGPIPNSVADVKVEYVTPELNIYRDMGDLLALDPPVPGLEPIPWDAATDTVPETRP